jgi:putative salt-induced outer membrane protein YdiY
MRSSAATLLFVIASALPAAAQDCPPCPAPAPSPTPTPEPAWKASFGGGLTVTGGNSETNNFNLAANVKHDPKKKNVFRFEVLHLQSSEEGASTVDRTQATLRDEYTVNGRLFVFGDLSYQRDEFQQVDYLIAPMVGAGFKLVDTAKVVASVDAGLGVAFEQLEGQDSTTDFAVRGGERLEWKPSDKTTLFQKATAIWKANDFGDAYYRFEVGVATSVARHFELKVAFADDYKTRPALVELDKHDTSFLVSLLFKL